MKPAVVIPLLVALVFAGGCIPKRVTEERLVADRYGDVSDFEAVQGSRTLVLKKTLQLTLPGGWHFDPEVEERTLFNVKAVMFAWSDLAGTQQPPLFLEYKESPRGIIPTQAELANLSQADAEDLKAVFRASSSAHMRVEDVEFVSFNGLRGVVVKSVVDAADRRPVQMTYSLKIPMEDTVGSFLFAYFERQDGPYLEKEMRDIFGSIQPVKPAKPKRRAPVQTQPAAQEGIPAQNGGPAHSTSAAGPASAQTVPSQNDVTTHAGPAHNPATPQNSTAGAETQGAPQPAAATQKSTSDAEAIPRPAQGGATTQAPPASTQSSTAQSPMPDTETAQNLPPAQHNLTGKLELSGKQIMQVKE